MDAMRTESIAAAQQLAQRNCWAGFYALIRLGSFAAAPGLSEWPAAAAERTGIVLRDLPCISPALQQKHRETVLDAWNALPMAVTTRFDVDASSGELLRVATTRPAPPPALPALILLCGYPGCGKSTFADALLRGCGDRCRLVRNDDMRGKGEIEAAAAAAARARQTLVVDACNLTLANRRFWLSWLSDRSLPRAWCVFFTMDVGECRERVVRRLHHPTLRTPSDGLRALAALDGVLVQPTLEEGFDRVECVGTDSDASALSVEWGGEATVAADCVAAPAEAGMFKFPRTSHIANLGSATRGDKLLSSVEVERLTSSGTPVVVTEKVDGANLGFSIAADGRIRVQNRGHYVDASYHEQFKPLDKWVATHTADLWTILRADEEPERFLLFGEWLYARHSVSYSRLPDWFLAFDLYDQRAGAFLSRTAMLARLEGTSIQAVPMLAHRALRGMDDLMELVRGPAAFGDGGTQREGVVVTLCDGADELVLLRGKLVAPAFLSGLAAGRWNAGAARHNELDR